MIKKVRKTIDKYNLVAKEERIVIALSGGPDSAALLAVLAQISKELHFSIIAAHYNHVLRGVESDDDEKYSRELADKFGVIFVSERMNAKLKSKAVSPEDFYRQKRYQFLNKVANNYQAQKIALGHNIQDQAETVLLNLLRGSGLEGLRGILPMREGKFIRPLIEVSRNEIIAFLNEAGISYCHDSSNDSKIFLRNKLRLELMPYLQDKFNPKIIDNLAQMAEILRYDDEFLQDSVKKALDSAHIKIQSDCISININYLKGLAPAVRYRIFKKLLENMSPEKNGFSFRNIKDLEMLTQAAESGKEITLPLIIKAKREYDDLILSQNNPNSSQLDYEYPVNIPCTINIKEISRTVTIEKITRDEMNLQSKNKVYLDLDNIQQPVILRNRRNGDWFQPLGMKGRQKIKSLFINQKITRNKRNETMLLVDQVSVIWIENMHLSDRVKISPEAINILVLEVINN